jgi:eukaryotic-like serine/threonine-protein kinase
MRQQTVAVEPRCHGEFSMWTLGAPEDAGGGVTTLRSINDASPVSVTRAIGTKDNVLVDIWIPGSGLTNQAATIAKRIG